MNAQPILITLHATFAELTALQAAANVYLDILEVVQPLELDKTRLEAIHHLESFKAYYQEMRAQGQEPKDVLLPLQFPFQEVMVLTTAIDVYAFMDKIHCLPTHTSGLPSIEVMTLTRSFQRRIVIVSPDN